MNAKRILIKGGHLVDAASGLDGVMDLALADGRIAGVNLSADEFHADEVLDASGCLVMPGIIDLAARVREPGFEYKATLVSELAAAAAGGITTLCCLPDTSPVIDTPAVVQWVTAKAEVSGRVDVLPIAALTQGLLGRDLSAMHALKRAGCLAVSNGFQPLANTLVLRHALEYAADQDLLVMMHPNDAFLQGRGCVHEGVFSARSGLPGIPDTAETVALGQLLPLVEQTGVRLHIAQLSCARAVEMVADAKSRGLNITADVAAHQLHLDESAVVGFDARYHVFPPFRTREDCDALRQGVISGVIDAVCSDHQPHDQDAKLDAFPSTEPGISGLQTLLALVVQLQHETGSPWRDLLARLSAAPAEVLGLRDRGQLLPGACADICVFDPVQNWRPDVSNWLSQGGNTPFWGHLMSGRVRYTLFRGAISFCAPE